MTGSRRGSREGARARPSRLGRANWTHVNVSASRLERPRWGALRRLGAGYAAEGDAWAMASAHPADGLGRWTRTSKRVGSAWPPPKLGSLFRLSLGSSLEPARGASTT